MNEDYRDTNVTRRTGLDDTKLLLVAILAPIVLVFMVILIVAGGPAIMKAVKMIWTALLPNFWVVLGYIYIGFTCWVIGRKFKK